MDISKSLKNHLKKGGVFIKCMILFALWQIDFILYNETTAILYRSLPVFDFRCSIYNEQG